MGAPPDRVLAPLRHCSAGNGVPDSLLQRFQGLKGFFARHAWAFIYVPDGRPMLYLAQ
jgi:hypothetical protein